MIKGIMGVIEVINGRLDVVLAIAASTVAV